jgi:hypothetical protein
MKKRLFAWLLGGIPAMTLVTVPAHAGGIFCQLFWFLPICNQGSGGGSAAVPEPATLVLVATGFGAAGFAAWRRHKKKDH